MRKPTAAFSLVELTLALGVAAFCLIALFGLIPVGVQINRNATAQTAATNIIAGVVADLRGTPKTNTASHLFAISIPPVGGSNTTPQLRYFDAGGASSTAFPSPYPVRYQYPKYVLSVTFPQVSPVPTPPAVVPTYVNLKVIWPAASPTPAVPSGSVEMFVALDRN